MVFFDAIRVKVRDEGTVRNKAAYVALGVRPEGAKEILAFGLSKPREKRFWLRVMNELKNRGVEDVLIAVVDGLKGFPEAITAVFPANAGSDLHRPSDPQLAQFCLLQGPQAGGDGAEEVCRTKDAGSGQQELEPSRKVCGAKNIRRSHNPGDAIGTRSSRFMHSRTTCAGSSTPQTL